MRPKLGHKRALLAVAHALVKAIYHLLATGQPYRETIPVELTANRRERIVHHHTRRLYRLGVWLPEEKLTPL